MISNLDRLIKLKLSDDYFDAKGEHDCHVASEILDQASLLGENEMAEATFTFLLKNVIVDSLRLNPESECGEENKKRIAELARSSDQVVIERSRFKRKYPIDPHHYAPLQEEVINISDMTGKDLIDFLNDQSRRLGKVSFEDCPTFIFITEHGNAVLTISSNVTYGLHRGHLGPCGVLSSAELSEYIVIERKSGMLRYQVIHDEPNVDLSKESGPDEVNIEFQWIMDTGGF